MASHVAGTNTVKGAGPTRAGLPTELPEWRLAMRCRGCGRWLTDPASVQAGIGPLCASREIG